MNYICMSHEDQHGCDDANGSQLRSSRTVRYVSAYSYPHTYMHMSVLTYSGLHRVLVIVYASNVVIRILRGKDIIARALHGHLLVCFEDFCDEKRKYKITELLFKENINE